MRTFGRCGGGGRRAASREKMPIPAVVSTVEESRAVTLVDLSATGARLSGRGLPPKGEAMWVKVDNVRRFGVVAWSTPNECGVEFDAQILPYEVARLKSEAKIATLTSGGIDLKQAMQDWESGFAR
jgi:hypothetical protein